MPCQTALSAARLASEVLAVSAELLSKADSNWLVVEAEAAASACWIAELRW